MSTPIRIALENLLEDLSFPSISWPAGESQEEAAVLECLSGSAKAVTTELGGVKDGEDGSGGAGGLVGVASAHGFTPYFVGGEAHVEALFYLASLVLRRRCEDSASDMHVDNDDLKRLDRAHREDAEMRKEMLRKRLNVTIQAFKWSDKVVGKEEVRGGEARGGRGERRSESALARLLMPVYTIVV